MPLQFLYGDLRTDSVGTGFRPEFTNRSVPTRHLVSRSVCEEVSRRWNARSLSSSVHRPILVVPREISNNMVLHADRGPDVAAAVITMVSPTSSSRYPGAIGHHSPVHRDMGVKIVA
jgi:hypothetical protein